jgi:hypothetical protein
VKYKLISDDEYKKTFKEESEVTNEALDLSLRHHGREFKRVVIDKTYKNGDIVK